MNSSRWLEISPKTCHFDLRLSHCPSCPSYLHRGQKNQRIHHTISRGVLLFYWDTGTPPLKYMILLELLLSQFVSQTGTTGTASAEPRSEAHATMPSCTSAPPPTKRPKTPCARSSALWPRSSKLRTADHPLNLSFQSGSNHP